MRILHGVLNIADERVSMAQNKINLVIFDLDGVILNSEPLHDHAKKTHP
jgi:hypothetical protein